MALLFLDSCDHITTTAQADLKTSTGTLLDAFETSGGRFGGGAYRLDGSADSIIRGVSSHTTIVAGGAVKFVNPMDSMTLFDEIISFREAGVATHVTVGVDRGFIRAKRGIGNGTNLGASATRIIYDTLWHFIEAKVFLSDTVGTVEVHVDGVQVLNLTVQDTINGGGGIVDEILWGRLFNASDTRWDDLYIDDANILGDSRIDLLMPDGDGNYTELGTTFGSATHAFNVDEIGPDGDTTYNNGTAVNQRDTFTMGNLAAITSQVIHGIQQVTYGKHDGTATNHRSKLRISAVDYNGASLALASTYGYHLEIWDQDPNAGPGAWVESVINGMESGYEEL